MNWDAFIAGMCMMSVFFNFNIRDKDNYIFNIIIFTIIMIISIYQWFT